MMASTSLEASIIWIHHYKVVNLQAKKGRIQGACIYLLSYFSHPVTYH